ncbi:MAG TPA: diacylglycerol kinase family protein [Aeromicrobium sp.]|nr:diacylglycerol kinase family protein [Aeromicrobium sp.]HKY59148.1 diacylglycerol kinase family protein [Aeromicrobium sp.]
MGFDVRRAEPRQPVLIWAAAAAPALIWIVLASGVAADAGWLTALDRPFGKLGADLDSNRVVHGFAVALGVGFSNWTTGVVLAAVAGFTAVRREYRLAVWAALCGVIIIVGNASLKHAFDRDRPNWSGSSWWQTGPFAFPSGHAAGAGVLATVAVLLTIAATMRGLRRRLLVALWVSVAVLVAMSRVILGVHYVSDVIAGLAFGMATGVALWALLVPQSARIPHDLAVLTGTGRKRVAVILNPTKVGDIYSFKGKVLEVVEREGWNYPLWYETTIDDPGQGQAQAALEAGVDLIVTAGGDGTVRAVCEEAARTGVAVGIIPLGTGNLLARNMGLPLNTREALDVAFGGQDRAIDLAAFSTDATFPEDHPAAPPAEPVLTPAPASAETSAAEELVEELPGSEPTPKELTETSFLVMAGLGMDAEIMLGVDDNLKKKVGWFAYFLSGIKALRFPTMRVHISVDDGPFHRFRARTVVIGNVGFLQAGIPLLPQAQLDDGLLDVVVLAPKRFIGWIAIVVRVMGRTRHTDRALNRMTGHKIVIRCDAPAPMQLDGDPVGMGTVLTAEVHHGVLLVRAPVAPAAPE